MTRINLNKLKIFFLKKGQTLVEYGLILALISVTILAVLTLLNTSIRDSFERIRSEIADAASS